MKKKAKPILSKQAIQDIAIRHRDTDPNVAVLAEMANEYRKIHRQGKKPKKKKKGREKKPQLKATDYFTIEQWSKIFEIIQSEPTKTVSRRALNQMLLILMVESGLRVSELCNLRLGCLPAHHGHRALHVVDGKGNKDRLVIISNWLADVLKDYVRRYKVNCGPDCYLFLSEQGGRLSTNSV